ncbi:hypothetical protein PSEUBRA_002976 [Kalmanozyma brasiliensis GHG001]|uniref:Uncharacterized protein n=1 Tax=Kalmanozyma brasiliensis (strain GHG001) TaxID=1365824 RepID=V5EWT3_KALBG|nr:uncharacterized protein PSEUBRA_002976 [Kalmanozyma brasiliensis GHG001]EST07858.1 hypothetical protein PSEUBRA_002976 [Kalmanozyma brasiliensis GHG001]
MALDAALFTLHFVRRRDEPWIVDIYPTSAGSSFSSAPPLPSKDDVVGASSSSSKITPFSGTIPDVGAQRALALESNDFSKQTPSYTRVRAVNHTQYSTILLDGLVSDILLASISQPNINSAKRKQILLFNPDGEVELEKRTMTFQQAWRFQFGDTTSHSAEEFSWKREGGPSRGSSTQSTYVCEVIRKPDPNVLAAQYRPPAGKGKPGALQLMDYNIDRLDIQDKKGLEVALVMSLSALLDQEYDDKIASRGERNLYICSNGIPTDLSTQGFSSAWQEAEARHGTGGARANSTAVLPGGERASPSHPDVDVATVDRIANLEPNELLITKWGSTDDYVHDAIQMLRCDGQGRSMYLITLLSDSAETTPKVVQVAAAIKAAYYRLPDDAKGTVYGRPANSSAIEDELYQYVQTLDDQPTAPASPPADATPKKRIIKLNPPSPSGAPPGSRPSSSPGPRSSAAPYQPPSKLKIILSKERIGELEPKKHDDAHPASTSAASAGSSSLHVPAKPSVPQRPISTSRPQQQPYPQAQMQSQQAGGSSGNGQPEKPSKGKALLSKLGIHH